MRSRPGQQARKKPRYAATRLISAVALGAGGAYLGHELSNCDPLATAAGAADGVIVSEGLHYAARKQSEKAYQRKKGSHLNGS